MKTVLFAAMAWALWTSVSEFARADLLPEETLETIVSVLNGEPAVKKTRNKANADTHQAFTVKTLREVLESSDLSGQVIEEVLACSMMAFFGKDYEGKSCAKDALYNEIQTKLFEAAHLGKKREKKVAPKLVVLVSPEPSQRIRKRRAALDPQKLFEEEVPTTWQADLVTEGSPFRLSRVRARSDADSEKPKKPKKRIKKEPKMRQAPITLFFDDLSPLKLRQDELETKWEDRALRARQFLSGLIEKYRNKKVTSQLVDELAVDLNSMPDYSSERDLIAGLFWRRPKFVDEGTYFNVYRTALRHPFPEKGLEKAAGVALKVMDPVNLKIEKLKLEANKQNFKMDRSALSMILMAGRTEYIPEPYSIILGRKVGQDREKKKSVWVTVEWVPQTAAKFIELKPMPESVIFEVFLAEGVLRGAGVCIGDWKDTNIGLVQNNRVRIYRIAGRIFVIPAGLAPKRLDAGELHLVTPRNGALGSYAVPSKCSVKMSSWATPSAELNQSIPFYQADLNAGEMGFLRTTQFLDLFKSYEFLEGSIEDLRSRLEAEDTAYVEWELDAAL